MSESFAVRGIIEGFYGVPWSHQQRLDMLEFVAGLGMNCYVYSPKDDPYLRRDWRLPYSAAHLAQLAELVTAAQSGGVSFMFALSPGLSMRYSVDGDIEDLLAKYRQLAGLGVTSFALLLDDIPEELQHAGDSAAFGSLVEAQVHLINRVHAALVDELPGARLTVCPTAYWGRGDDPYLVSFGRGIPAEVDIFFTGRAICAAEIELADAQRFEAATGHAPLYWDNFPVNDVAMTGELHIGPYRGRDPELASASRGIISNAMPLAEASRIAFVSIADYLNDPGTFDQEASWLRALRIAAGESGFEALRVFADTVRGSCLCTDDAPQLQAALQRFAFDSEFGDRRAAFGALRVEVARLAEAAWQLRAGVLGNSALLSEIEPWLAQYERGVSALSVTVELIAEGALDEAGRAAVFAQLSGLRESRLRVFGDALDMFLSDLAEEFVRR